jgi:peptide/nickel transport system ATP-binding protein
MLDVSIRAEILEILIGLRERYGIAILFITHDLALARHICDRIAVMYLGRIVEIAPTEELVEKPLHPYTKALIAAIPEPDPRNRFKYRNVPIKGEIPSAAAIPPGCRFRPRCVAFDNASDDVKTRCQSAEPPLVEVESNHFAACWLIKR